MKRRTIAATALGGVAVFGAAAWTIGRSAPSPAHAASPGQGGGSGLLAELARGPSAVILGNPAGDVTMVEFFDYQCPVCRRVQPDVRALLEEDPGVRLVHKHWPMLTPTSTYAARMALASRWQEGRYEPLHQALMRLPGRLDDNRVRAAAESSGINLIALERDQRQRSDEIDVALGEALVQARQLRLQGTPGFVIGRYLVPGGMDLAGMREVVGKIRSES
ncbi:DsbA family protein [Roseomonas sp. KE2513]|uniref:DsbA family protein n=1 Tax=Roseomonas sp. KE2513 TaxID=2479202 RepID=UPI0018DFA7D7|nr:DsbA family protein [Roseomonas sp. KE2513]